MPAGWDGGDLLAPGTRVRFETAANEAGAPDLAVRWLGSGQRTGPIIDTADVTRDGRRIFATFGNSLHGMWIIVSPAGDSLVGEGGWYSDTYNGLGRDGRVTLQRTPCGAETATSPAP